MIDKEEKYGRLNKVGRKGIRIKNKIFFRYLN